MIFSLHSSEAACRHTDEDAPPESCDMTHDGCMPICAQAAWANSHKPCWPMSYANRTATIVLKTSSFRGPLLCRARIVNAATRLGWEVQSPLRMAGVTADQLQARLKESLEATDVSVIDTSGG